MAEAVPGRWRISTCVVLGLLLATPVQAITATFGDIEITPEPSPKGTSSHGYFEYVFYVVNKSAERPHTVSLSIPFEKTFVPIDSIRELRRTVQVGANETVRVSLLQPDYPPLAGVDVAVTIDGRRQEREVQFKLSESLRRFSYRGRGYASTPVIAEPLILLGPRVKPLPMAETVIVSGGMMPAGMPGGPAVPAGMGGATAAVPPPPPSKRSNMAPPGTTATPMPSRLLLRDRLGVSLLRLQPVEMLGILPLSPLARSLRMVLAWQMGELEMSPGKPGLSRGFQFVSADTWSNNWLAYSRYDGIILTAAEFNALTPDVQTALWQYVETGGALLVLGRIELRGLSAVTETKKDNAGWLEVSAGFGVCRISPDANYDAWKAEHFGRLMEDWRNTTAAWSARDRSILSANREFPIIDDLGIPIKGLFILMFLFTLGIGPVNIFVLSRLKRRIWFLWTTPLLSLCTCLAVFGFMLISEGWEGRLKSETLTLLDETTHRATTIGWTGVYSPLTPGEGLHFSRETEVIPQSFFQEQSRGARTCTIDWTEDQHFASGWVEARVPAHFKVRKSELRRERVALQRERDGRWSMVNGLGAAVRRFWYADAKGQIHVAEDVGPGAKATLSLTEKESLVPANRMQGILMGNTSNWMSAMQLIQRNPPNYLRPGMYLAEVDDSPFLEDALRSARTRRLHALVVGFGP